MDDENHEDAAADSLWNLVYKKMREEAKAGKRWTIDATAPLSDTTKRAVELLKTEVRERELKGPPKVRL